MFIHVHKCAGTAISKAFFYGQDRKNPEWLAPIDSADAEDIMNRNNTVLNSDFSAPEHFRALDMQGLLGTEIYNSYFKFAVSRNPWERLASWYFFLRQSPNKEQNKVARFLTMEEFIKFSVDYFYVPQIQWLIDGEGEIIVDKIVKLEDLDDTWPEISEKGLGKVVKLGMINASSNTTEPRPNPFEFVTTATLELFRDAYADDFERLGYDNSLPPHIGENGPLASFERIWQAEAAGDRDLKGLCDKHDVDLQKYRIYREVQSARFYNEFAAQSAKRHSAEVNKFKTAWHNASTDLKKANAAAAEAKAKSRDDFLNMQKKVKLLAEKNASLAHALRNAKEKEQS